jgi:hypothetical protein
MKREGFLNSTETKKERAMSKNEGKKWVVVVGRMLLALVFVFSQMAWAGQELQTKDKSQSPQKAAAEQAVEQQSSTAATVKAQRKQAQGEESESSVAEEKSSRDGSHEGIKVHGHWTIEVKNPDGTVVTDREFENSLMIKSGDILLSSVLGRVYTVGSVSIRVIDTAVGTTTGSPTLFIAEAGTFDAATFAQPCGSQPGLFSCSTNLTITAANGTLTLAGSAVIPSSFGPNVTFVGTAVNACGAGISPQTCLSASVGSNLIPYGFTSRSLDGLNGNPAPVAVSPGQTAAVTVVISFS